eukprot:1151462-Pelagomonas_calceolata.AAC.2
MSKGAKRAVSLLERSPAQNLLLALKEKAMRQGLLLPALPRSIPSICSPASQAAPTSRAIQPGGRYFVVRGQA